MDQLIKSGKYAFFSLLSGFILAVSLNQWTWLEMRANTAIVLPFCLAAGLMLSFRCSNLHAYPSALLLQSLCLVLLLAFYNGSMDALLVIPAILFRTGFGLHTLNLNQVNGLILSILFLSNALWLWPGVASKN